MPDEQQNETSTEGTEQDAQPDLADRLAALEASQTQLTNRLTETQQHNQILARYASGLEEQVKAGKPVVEAPPPPELDEDVKKYVDSIQQASQQQTLTLQDRLDAMEFQNAMLSSGLPQDLVPEVEKLVANQRQKRIPSFNEYGQATLYSRKDALVTVLGARAMQQARTEAPTKALNSIRTQLNLPNGGVERGGGAPPPNQQNVMSWDDFNQLPLTERIKRNGEALDKMGGW
jgi:hypothetical protein